MRVLGAAWGWAGSGASMGAGDEMAASQIHLPLAASRWQSQPAWTCRGVVLPATRMKQISARLIRFASTLGLLSRYEVSG